MSRFAEDEESETYLGYERWLPTPPKVVKPRSVFNATSLAYIGDGIYEVNFFTILFIVLDFLFFMKLGLRF